MIKPLQDFLPQLTAFFHDAAIAGWASTEADDDGPSSPRRPGHTRHVYRRDNFLYEDEFAGFFRSRGEEIVYWNFAPGNNAQGATDWRPVWDQQYRGGVMEEKIGDTGFAGAVFGFLKQALADKPRGQFQPRGPNKFELGDWKYSADWDGDIKSFRGEETVYRNGLPVFFHWFQGGLLWPKRD
ncbi:MAG: DUF5680 domain-containing protein [Rhodospirillales bacterium]